MKAVVYTEYGPPDVLKLTEIDKPTPQDNEVLIKIHARSVGFGDLLARNFPASTPRSFNMPGPLWFIARLAIGWNKPRATILGAELAGKVEAVGSAVTQFKVGDQVFAYPGQSFGANAEYMCMRENAAIAHMPANMSYEEAATVPYGAITALLLLRKANVQPGQKVLIIGASGSIGSFAVQLAKHYGAEVTGICGTQRIEMVKTLGADHVIDYTKEDFTQNGQTYDLIFDVLGRSKFKRGKHSLKPGGIYQYASFKLAQVGAGILTSFSGDKKVICGMAFEKQADLVEVKELVEAGAIKTVIDRTFPLEQTADAHRHYESGQRTGHVVIVSEQD